MGKCAGDAQLSRPVPEPVPRFATPLERQYATLVRDWVSAIHLDPSGYGTHSLRRTKAALIYRKTGNLRAVQLLLGHAKVDSTVWYLGVELEDALSIAERIDI
jgi:integrase